MFFWRWASGFGIWGFEFWVLSFGLWVLGSGFWVLGFEFGLQFFFQLWFLGFGFSKIILMIKWIRTSRLSIKKFLSHQEVSGVGTADNRA